MSNQTHSPDGNESPERECLEILVQGVLEVDIRFLCADQTDVKLWKLVVLVLSRADCSGLSLMLRLECSRDFGGLRLARRSS